MISTTLEATCYKRVILCPIHIYGCLTNLRLTIKERTLLYKKWLLREERRPHFKLTIPRGEWDGGTKDAIWVNKRHPKYALLRSPFFADGRDIQAKLSPIKVWIPESWVFLHPSPRFITSFLECNHFTPFLINSVPFFQKSMEEKPPHTAASCNSEAKCQFQILCIFHLTFESNSNSFS